jgi:hypothetical protein
MTSPRSRPARDAQISKSVTHYLATGLFFFFGLRSLYDAVFAWKPSEELAEVEAELNNGLGDGKKKKAAGARG